MTTPTPAPAPAGSTLNTILTDVETAGNVAQQILPNLISVLSFFIPSLGALVPYLNLLPVAIQAVNTVQQDLGTTPAAATAAVVAHLTPGQPNAAALSTGGTAAPGPGPNPANS